MRKLASAQRVLDIQPIPDADAIEHVRVNGWWVVCKKEEFKVGDLVLYFEIDSWVPHHLAPFLSKGKTPREYNGVQGEKLRTIRLRKALSQGLILPLMVQCEEGDDLTEVLGVQLWEAPIHASLRGKIKGNFPSFIRKTDQERIQNIYQEVLKDLDAKYEVSLKLHGSSMTVYCNQGAVGVCSRNIDLKLEDETNTFVSTAFKYNLPALLEAYYKTTGRSIALQGELLGPGICGNKENYSEYLYYLFDVWDIDEQRYLPHEDRQLLATSFNIFHVPTFSRTFNLSKLDSLEKLLEFAVETDFAPGFSQPIEGLVFKREDGQFSFKVINNEFLLNEK